MPTESAERLSFTVLVAWSLICGLVGIGYSLIKSVPVLLRSRKHGKDLRRELTERFGVEYSDVYVLT